MARQWKCGRTVVLAAALVWAALILGCGDQGGSPSGPELGEEVDLSLYEPENVEDLNLTYEVTLSGTVREASVWYCGCETVYEMDPDTGQEVPIECDIFEQEGERGGIPSSRIYVAGRYLYGIKSRQADRWGPLYLFQPKRPLAPEGNPRIGSTFDSGLCTITSVFESQGTTFRQVESYRFWTTYEAIEDSLEVPAGKFYDVLRTRVRTRYHLEQTLYPDTTVVVTDYTSEDTQYVWIAEGIGTIKVADARANIDYEKVLVRANVDGETYPRTK